MRKQIHLDQFSLLYLYKQTCAVFNNIYCTYRYTDILRYTELTFLPVYSSCSSQNPKLGNDLLDFWPQCILL